MADPNIGVEGPSELRMRSSSDVSDLAQLLRGIPASVIAANWCLFRDPGADRSTYDLSRPVNILDVFISHSWSGSPLWKQISFLTTLYLREGYIAMFIVVIPLSIGVYVLPSHQELASVLVELVGVIAMCLGVVYGYRLVKKKSEDMVFLNKCCIPQDDPAAKERGICSIHVLIACVMLACRTPLFAFVACKLTTSAGRHGVPNWIVIVVVLVFGVLYDATEIVGGGVALFDSSLATRFKLPEPYGWVFVIPACGCLLAIWRTYCGLTF
ncbi:hypothetical protein FOL47_001226 [Perkinsus chesapeaki]|uniref:Uncharacterized protein n=1 Tax=Perkinsus chesapeaki TaxID=330153 RepID=A0A7J6MKQ8_PERCH|nr:hypothetical protein FOL47_001226 [Perkinsus chesapeaki]